MKVYFKKVKDSVKQFVQEEDGVGVVEIMLILAVLICLVFVFKSQVKSIVDRAEQTVTDNTNNVFEDLSVED